MQKVVGFFSKPENLFVLTLLIGLFTGTYKVVSKASNHNNSLYQRVSSPICFYLRLFGYVYTLPWIGSLLIFHNWFGDDLRELCDVYSGAA